MFEENRMHQYIEQHPKSSFVIYIIILSLVITIWSRWIAPEFKKIPDDFSYTADILSLDNFYDEKAQKFEGEHISKTTFSYEVISVSPSYLAIKNSFKVRKLNDKPIFSVSRLYYIDPENGRHVNVPGQEQRTGYLFAPHYASQDPFYYWHINYDAPALMKFVGKEKINGLTVYRYLAQYQADQTANLTNLPGVPEKRGIRADINLQLWIEPISGWLVKYQDNTLAYYYNIGSGKMLAPWNSFSNRYTQNSINEKVEQATLLKWKFLFVDFGVPMLIFLVSFLIVFHSLIIRKNAILSLNNFYNTHKNMLVIISVCLVLFVACISSIYYIFFYQTQRSVFKIGISQWNNNIELLSAIQGFKDGLAEYGFHEGKEVEFSIESPQSSILSQINIIQSFIRDKVNVIYTLTTPGTLVARGVTNKIPIIFSDVSYPVESGIINSRQSSQTNLVGTLNYISPAEQFFQFDVIYPNTKKLGFVHHIGDPDSEIQFQEFKDTLSQRNIDVIDIPAIDFDDIKNQLQQQLNQHAFNVLFVACDSLMRDGGGKIAAEFSRNNKIPSFTCDRDSVLHGVMEGYLPSMYSMGKLAGIKAALILRGAEPSWLKTESPERGYLMINKSTAELLGITVPEKSSGMNYEIAE